MFTWLEYLADTLVYNIFNIEAGSALGKALSFFFYDVVKIMLLLYAISLLMSYVNAIFPVDKLRDFLVGKKLFGLQYVLAALFGAVTPFCSCSSVPLFIGFVKGGIPLGVTFAFLITSPLVNEIALALFIGYFGLKTTVIYAISGIMLGAVGGFVLGKMNLEHLLTPWVKNLIAQNTSNSAELSKEKISFSALFPNIIKEANAIVKGVFWYVVIGIAVGAGMHGFVPDNFFEAYMQSGTWYAVPLAVLLAVPLYANAAGLVPVIQVFVAKGIPLGTAIAFMMSAIGLSIPEGAMLKKVMTLKLIAIFFGTVAGFIMLSGFLFNLIFTF
ncbi:MAG: permease [Luteibaculaceae bacterium]